MMRTFGYTEDSFMLEPNGSDVAFLYQVPGLIITEKDAALHITYLGDNKARFVQALRKLRAHMARTGYIA